MTISVLWDNTAHSAWESLKSELLCRNVLEKKLQAATSSVSLKVCTLPLSPWEHSCSSLKLSQLAFKKSLLQCFG